MANMLQKFVRKNDSAEEQRLELQWNMMQMRTQNISLKRQLEKATLENDMLKKKKSDANVVDKADRAHVEWALTHGGQIQTWSKELINLQESLKILDRKEDHLLDIKKHFQAKLLPKNLPKYLKGLDHETSYEYPEVVTDHHKKKRDERLWKYRLEVLEDAMENLAAKRAVWDASTAVIMDAARKDLGETLAAKFKKACVEMAFIRRNAAGRMSTPNSFEVIP